MDTAQLLYQFHDIEYKIFNHVGVSKSKPLAVVAFHACEDINENSLLESVIQVYVMKNIGEIFKLSLFEYLDLPVDIVDMLNSIADRVNSKKAVAVTNLENQFKDISK